MSVYLIDLQSEGTAAAWSWLSKESLALARLTASNPDPTKKSCPVWIHAESGRELDQTREWVLPCLRRIIHSGQPLLLTLQACRLVKDLGLEKDAPDLIEENEIIEQEKEWGMRGLLSFMRHPLFRPFHGGIYLWNPMPGDRVSTCGYHREAGPKQAERIAVDRSYIANDPNKIYVWEYLRPRVLCVGAYVSFLSRDEIYDEARKVFLKQCFAYLYQEPPDERPQWPLPQIGVEQQRLSGKILKAPQQPMASSVSTPRLEASCSNSPFFSLAGRRILLMGRLARGIEEVWVYPFRLLSSLSVQIEGREEVALTAEVHHEKVKWRYGASACELTAYASLDMPTAALTLSGLNSEEIAVFRFRCDLRMMWNYPVGSTGKLQVRQRDDGIEVFSQHFPGMGWFAVSGNVRDIHVADTSDERESSIVCTIRCSPGRADGFLAFRFGGAFGAEEKRRVSIHQRQSLRLLMRGAEKAARALVQQNAKLACPDAWMEQAYRWAKLRLEAFFAVTPGLGAGYLAGFMTTRPGFEESRPGYAWYFGRDSVYTGFAALAMGRFSNVRQTLRLLAAYQRFDGKIFHECTTSGILHYDAADATPLFLLLLARYYHWTGDRALVQEFWPCAAKAMAFLLSTDRDGDGLIENTHVGHGWIEGGRIYGAHVTFYLAGLWVKTLHEMALLARIMGEEAAGRTWADRATTLQKAINKRFWDEKLRHFCVGIRKDGRRMPFITIMPSVPIWMGVCEREKAESSIEHMLRKEMMSDWGVRMVSEKEPFYRPAGYHDGSVWPLYTGWVILAAYQLGMPHSAFQVLQQQLQIFQYFSPGNMPEVLRGDRFEPAGVCPHQAWSEAMCVLPVVEGLWGIEPHNGTTVSLRPRLPVHWTAASLSGVAIGNTRLDIRFRRDATNLHWEFIVSGEGLQLRFRPQMPLVYRKRRIIVNGVVSTQMDFPVVLNVRPGKTTVSVELDDFFDIVMRRVDLKPGAVSRGIALLRAIPEGNRSVSLLFQGAPGAVGYLHAYHEGSRWKPNNSSVSPVQTSRHMSIWKIQMDEHETELECKFYRV